MLRKGLIDSIPIRRGKQADLPLNVAIIGGGMACFDLLQLLDREKRTRLRMEILGVADANGEAPGLRYARELGLYTTTRISSDWKGST
jgi:acetaldehyde dehydrogenase (acetylating)